MAKGGARPGAGRPKTKPEPVDTMAEAVELARKYGMSPLEYMFKVFNNPEADPLRRDRMSIAAAPFSHAKPSEASASVAGKKEQQADAAKTAGEGTGWGEDLAVPGARPN